MFVCCESRRWESLTHNGQVKLAGPAKTLCSGQRDSCSYFVSSSSIGEAENPGPETAQTRDSKTQRRSRGRRKGCVDII